MKRFDSGTVRRKSRLFYRRVDSSPDADDRKLPGSLNPNPKDEFVPVTA